MLCREKRYFTNVMRFWFVLPQFYSVPVRASDRGRITEIELVQQLLRIMETKADPRTPPVGILTTTKRPAWTKAREELIKSTYDDN